MSYFQQSAAQQAGTHDFVLPLCWTGIRHALRFRARTRELYSALTSAAEVHIFAYVALLATFGPRMSVAI